MRATSADFASSGAVSLPRGMHETATMTARATRRIQKCARCDMMRKFLCSERAEPFRAILAGAWGHLSDFRVAVDAGLCLAGTPPSGVPRCEPRR